LDFTILSIVSKETRFHLEFFLRESYSSSIALCQYCALDECMVSWNEDGFNGKELIAHA